MHPDALADVPPLGAEQDLLRPRPNVRQGVLLKYIRTVSDASHGCITDLEEENHVSACATIRT